MYNDTAMRKNKIFHTIGNTRLGGVIEGLIDSYHSPLVFPEVNNEPTKATK